MGLRSPLIVVLLTNATGKKPLRIEEAMKIIKHHGVVLEAAKGPVPNLAEIVAGERIRGSWWGHPQGQQIFFLTRSIRERQDVLVCRLVEGKITYVHRRLWPALACLADHFEKEHLAAIREVHTAMGKHKVQTTSFSDWVPPAVLKEAKELTEDEALSQLGGWV